MRPVEKDSPESVTYSDTRTEFDRATSDFESAELRTNDFFAESF